MHICHIQQAAKPWKEATKGSHERKPAKETSRGSHERKPAKEASKGSNLVLKRETDYDQGLVLTC
jgi:hypothetical protein